MSLPGINLNSLLPELKDPNGTSNPVFYAAVLPVYVLTTIIFFARILTRAYPSMRLWWDDLFLALAFAVETALVGITIRVAVVTGGRHILFLQTEALEYGVKLGYVVYVLFPTCNALIKISLCMMVLRIKRGNPVWRWSLWSFIGLVAVAGISNSLSTVFTCRPINAFWNLEDRFSSNKCWPIAYEVYIGYGFGAFFVVTNFIMALLPIAFLRNVKLPLRDKIILCALMGSGLLAMGAGIAKIFLFKQIYVSLDYIYQTTLFSIAIHLELLIGIMAACVPTLKAPFENMLRSLGLIQSTGATRAQNYRKALNTEMSVFSNHGKDHSFDATISSSRNGPVPGRKDVIVVNESVLWEASSLEEGRPTRPIDDEHSMEDLVYTADHSDWH